MNTVTENPANTNIGTRITAFTLACGKLVSGAMMGLTTAALLAAVLSDCATASELPVQAVQRPITLAEAIEISLANNPELAAASYVADAASAERDIAAGARLPEIRIRGAYDLYREARLITPRRPGPSSVLGFTDELLFGNVVLTVPLYTGGQLKNQVVAAEFITQAKWQLLLHSRTELVFNVSSVFYSMLGQREVINSLIFSQEALEQHHKRANELFDAQKAARVDLLRTEVRLADIEQRLIRERNVLKIKGFLLASLLGLNWQDGSLQIEGELMQTDVPVNLDQARAEAFRNRQDYQSLESRVCAQQKQVDIAGGARMPKLSLGASYGDRWATDSSRHNEVGEVGMFLDIPLFEGGRISARIRRECSLLQAQQEALRTLELQIQLEVETASSNIEATIARVAVTEKAIEQAKESLRIEREKYELGRGAILDVLDAQSALLDSQTNYAQAQAECNTALAQFRLAVGEAY